MLTVNNLLKLNENSQFRTNITYLNDKRNQDLWQYSGYYLPGMDSILSLNHTNNRTNTLETNLTYTNNAPKTYINNSLKFQGRWNHISSDITGFNRVSQYFDIPLFYLQNNLSLVKHSGKKIFQFDSFTRYSTLPQRLNVMTDTLNSFITQEIVRSTFYTNNKTSFGYSKPSYNLLLDLQLLAKTENFDSNMNFTPFLDEETKNKIETRNLIFNIGPQFTYRKNDFNLSFKLPLSSNNIAIKNGITDERKDYYYFFIEPSVSLRYKLGPFWTANLSFQYRNDTGDILDFPLSYYMINYRYMKKGAGVFGKRESQAYSLRIAYRNTIQAFFFNISILYNTRLGNLLNNTSFRNNISLVSLIELDNQRNNRAIAGSIAKYFDELRTNFSLSGNYTNMKMDRLQQNVKVPITLQTLFLQPKIDTKVKNWLSVIYYAEILNNTIDRNDLNQKNHNSFNQIRQDLEFSLDWINIFNKKTYFYTVDDGLNIFFSQLSFATL